MGDEGFLLPVQLTAEASMKMGSSSNVAPIFYVQPTSAWVQEVEQRMDAVAEGTR